MSLEQQTLFDLHPSNAFALQTHAPGQPNSPRFSEQTTLASPIVVGEVGETSSRHSPEEQQHWRRTDERICRSWDELNTQALRSDRNENLTG